MMKKFRHLSIFKKKEEPDPDQDQDQDPESVEEPPRAQTEQRLLSEALLKQKKYLQICQIEGLVLRKKLVVTSYRGYLTVFGTISRATRRADRQDLFDALCITNINMVEMFWNVRDFEFTHMTGELCANIAIAWEHVIPSFTSSFREICHQVFSMVQNPHSQFFGVLDEDKLEKIRQLREEKEDEIWETRRDIERLEVEIRSLKEEVQGLEKRYREIAGKATSNSRNTKRDGFLVKIVANDSKMDGRKKGNCKEVDRKNNDRDDGVLMKVGMSVHYYRA